MAAVEVRQIGHVAVKPEVQTFSVDGHPQTKVVVTVISNTRWKDRKGVPQERKTAISWTLWGDLALNAGQSLGIGSKVAVAGILESRRYPSAGRREIFSFGFTARSVHYLESRADTEARGSRRATSVAEDRNNRRADREV